MRTRHQHSRAVRLLLAFEDAVLGLLAGFVVVLAALTAVGALALIAHVAGVI